MKNNPLLYLAVILLANTLAISNASATMIPFDNGMTPHGISFTDAMGSSGRGIKAWNRHQGKASKLQMRLQEMVSAHGINHERISMKLSRLKAGIHGHRFGGPFDSARVRATMEAMFNRHNYTRDAFTTTGPAAPVPVPPALWLFGSGLLGLIGIARRRKS